MCLGLTPLVDNSLHWHDAPSDRLLGLKWPEHLSRALLRPLGGGLDSEYTRKRHDGTWIQQGVHQLHLLPGWRVTAHSEVQITPQGGCEKLSLTLPGSHLEAELEEIRTLEDHGIPQTRKRVA